MDVLFIDDTKCLAESYAQYFSLKGFTVKTALNAVDAKVIAMHEKCAIAFVDARLGPFGSPLEGLEVLRFIHSRWPSCHLFVLTALESREIAVAARECGAGVLHKPKALKDMEELIRRAVMPVHRVSASAAEKSLSA